VGEREREREREEKTVERGRRENLVVFFYYARKFCFVCLFVLVVVCSQIYS
jgi:hypothetical protein